MGKVKKFFNLIWSKLSKLDPVVAGIWAIFVIVLVGFLIIRHHNQTKEIAQDLHPSIGDALTPDTPAQPSGNVAGDFTAPKVAETEPVRVAPHTGVDPKEPVVYENSDLKFAATLPIGTQVSEQPTVVTFTDKNSKLIYSVSINNSETETLTSIETELRNSPSVSNIAYGTFGETNTPILKFAAKGFGQGMVILANKKIYYLLGDSKFFTTFKTF